MKANFSLQKADFSPVCPHCDAEMNDVAIVIRDHVPFRTVMFACPACHKLLGVARTSSHGRKTA